MKEFMCYPKSTVNFGYNHLWKFLEALNSNPSEFGPWESLGEFHYILSEANDGLKTDLNIFSPDLANVLDTIIHLAAKQLSEVVHKRSTYGICYSILLSIRDKMPEISKDMHLRKCLRELLYNRLSYFFALDPNFSGDWAYPVKAPLNGNPKAHYLSTTHLWLGKYGESRKAMLENLVKTTALQEISD